MIQEGTLISFASYDTYRTTTVKIKSRIDYSRPTDNIIALVLKPN